MSRSMPCSNHNPFVSAALNSISCATFWSVDPAFGWCMQNTVSVLVTAVATAKIAFRGPRPMWLSKDVSVSEKVLQEVCAL